MLFTSMLNLFMKSGRVHPPHGEENGPVRLSCPPLSRHKAVRWFSPLPLGFCPRAHTHTLYTYICPCLSLGNEDQGLYGHRHTYKYIPYASMFLCSGAEGHAGKVIDIYTCIYRIHPCLCHRHTHMYILYVSMILP